MSEEFDKTYWETRYRGSSGHWVGQPNPQLVAEVAELTLGPAPGRAPGTEPGTALDAGCGEGADAAWLASRGWRVTAVDISSTALRRAREHAATLGAEIAGRIDWVLADLTTWTPAENTFDLVTTHYVHAATSRDALFRRLAAAVAPAGTLLIVGHHPSDHLSQGAHVDTAHGSKQDSAHAVHFTAEEIAAALDPDRWDIAVAETRSRTAVRPDGQEVTIRDAVLRARKTRTA